MSLEELNEAPVNEQLRARHAKLLALVLWKLSPKAPVLITIADIDAFAEADAVLFQHGRTDGIELSLISREAAERLAALKTPVGHA